MTKSEARELPLALYRAEHVRALDRAAIEQEGIPGLELMERAGRAAFLALRERWPQARRLGVACGGGNNAGDGYVVARLASAHGLEVSVWQLGDADRLQGAAREAYARMQAAGVNPVPFEAGALAGVDVLVDALFGTGLDRAVEGTWAEAVTAINGSGRPVLAIDIPSGLHADTGRVLGVAVRAALTVSFIGLKQGMFTGAGGEHCGRIVFDDLGVPPSVYETVAADARRLRTGSFSGLLGRRERTAHKGDFGHVLLIGGAPGFGGATRMAGEAALRVGAGLVSLATHPEHTASLTATRPELMCHGVEEPGDLQILLARATVLGIGPGLGQSEWSEALLDAALAAQQPLVVDADALNLLARREPPRRGHWILTPHPGEAARLLGSSGAEVQSDRFAAAQALAARYRAVVVLKGAGTLVLAPGGEMGVCDAGNPGMASGGMGDVLTGVLAGLLAQRLSLQQAAALGVALHAEAADVAAADGQRGLLASDLMPFLRRLANP